MVDRVLQRGIELNLPIKYDVVLVKKDLFSPELAGIFILKLAGCQNSGIANGFGIAEQTVKNDVNTIMNQASEYMGIEGDGNFNWIVAQMYRHGLIMQLPRNWPSLPIENYDSNKYELKLTIPRHLVKNFTNRQGAVLYRLLDGYNTPRTAQEFKIHERTIKSHIYGKTESTNTTIENMAKIYPNRRGIFGNLAIILGHRPRSITGALYQMMITGVVLQVPNNS